ncbi:hypothetical protein K432DRAFT_389844 [Lepidopterella palustris CBS 459.81]|uniref:Rhodopsin domain-containing protein n=1 Tax=Lepidopterella palustris CBS 459.81 TaxID=1314670 RepID=A0A8E2EHH4_9PEZI|nr:hypothetical protein K432DRAFT_389844 [Lepidopterella palustris CBS 459.81]
MILSRELYSNAPPEPRTRMQNNPTLLFSWWCTGFALVIILFRLAGRYVRNECLFREDKIMALSIIPLFLRMGFIHVVLIFGTNNVDTAGLTSIEIHHRAIGSRMVLGARIFYALFIWTAKFTVSEFLKRMTSKFWKKSYEVVLRGIRIFLLVTFLAVVIATLGECQPFDHYWQVTPDPGPKCRQGYAHLITMGVTDMITDILLVVFPIPIIIKSAMPLKRKISLTLLFSMSIILIGITGARIPSVINRRGRQQYRTVFASGEILAAAAVSNAIILGSFLRDRGIKKAKYKFGSTTDSMERPSLRRPTLQQWGSDEDLIRDMGYRLDPQLHDTQNVPRPAPVADIESLQNGGQTTPFSGKNWQFPNGNTNTSRDSEDFDLKAPVVEDSLPSPRDIRVVPPRRNVSFFDVGGLLDDNSVKSPGILPSPTSTTSAQDFAQPRKGSRALLSDLGGLLSHGRGHSHPFPRRGSRPSQSEEGSYEMTPRSPEQRRASPPTGVVGPQLTRHETIVSLQDPGGLLTDGAQPTVHTNISSHRPSNSSSHTDSSRPGNRSISRQDTIMSLQDVGGLLSPTGHST